MDLSWTPWEKVRLGIKVRRAGDYSLRSNSDFNHRFDYGYKSNSNLARNLIIWG
jgi:hypothetical protein